MWFVRSQAGFTVGGTARCRSSRRVTREDRLHLLCRSMAAFDVCFRRKVNSIDAVARYHRSPRQKFDFQERSERTVVLRQFLGLSVSTAEHSLEPWLPHRRERRWRNDHLQRRVLALARIRTINPSVPTASRSLNMHTRSLTIGNRRGELALGMCFDIGHLTRPSASAARDLRDQLCGRPSLRHRFAGMIRTAQGPYLIAS